jgi:hypothetical protein
MRCLLKLLLLCPVIAVSTSGQTAHDYFNGLKAANTFNHIKDEYVCFQDEDAPSFAVIAKVSDVIEQKEKAGDTNGIKTLEQEKDNLFVQTYYMGVASQEYIYGAVKRGQLGDTAEYRLVFNGQKPGEIVYAINWTTGRYLLRVYIYRQSRTIPATEHSGKCELIHPGQS